MTKTSPEQKKGKMANGHKIESYYTAIVTVKRPTARITNLIIENQLKP